MFCIGTINPTFSLSSAACYPDADGLPLPALSHCWQQDKLRSCSHMDGGTRAHFTFSSVHVYKSASWQMEWKQGRFLNQKWPSKPSALRLHQIKAGVTSSSLIVQILLNQVTQQKVLSIEIMAHIDRPAGQVYVGRSMFFSFSACSSE